MTPLEVTESLPTQISQSATQTYAAYIPAQQARLKEILKTQPIEASFGKHDRQKLDVFLPEKVEEGKKYPVLVWMYGGAWYRGAKRYPGSDGALFGNLGRFFSDQGFITVLPDYRLISHSDQGFLYPSGAEDLSLALEWIAKEGNIPSADLNNVFLSGSSAGGVNTATFLYASHPTITPLSKLSLTIRGAVLISAPGDHLSALDDSMETRITYYEGEDLMHERSFNSLRTKSEDKTDLLVVWAERDSDPEIIQPCKRFLALYDEGKVPGNPSKPDVLLIKRHNHVSPAMALGLGGDEDAWGYDVVDWMKKRIVA